MITKNTAYKEFEKYINKSFYNEREKEIIMQLIIDKETLQSVGEKSKLTRERVRQIKSAWIRRNKYLPERLHELLQPFIEEFSFNERYTKINDYYVNTLKLMFAKNNKSEFTIINNCIVDKNWVNYKNKIIKKQLHTLAFADAFPFYGIEKETIYKGIIFAKPLGIINHKLLTTNVKSIKIENIINDVNQIFPGNSVRSLGVLCERKESLLKISLNEFTACPKNIFDISQEIFRTIEASHLKIFGKQEFLYLMQDINEKYNFIKHEAYYILKRYYSNYLSFSTGNRMVISKIDKVETIGAILKNHFGLGPSLIDISYGKKHFKFTDTIIINNNNLYNYNNQKYLYFDSSLYPKIRELILETLEEFSVDLISYSRIQKTLIKNNKGTKFEYIFASNSLTKVLKKALKNVEGISVTGLRGNLNISTKK
ncbi:MAG: hypothetical protein HRT98_02510 [Mycoplasmatales bacterium]|nr:hypothetical protein [Mycoplasmatales bacterium]